MLSAAALLGFDTASAVADVVAGRRFYRGDRPAFIQENGEFVDGFNGAIAVINRNSRVQLRPGYLCLNLLLARFIGNHQCERVLPAATLLAPTLPDVTVWNIHPVTQILLGFYFYGTRLIQSAGDKLMWRPSITGDTRQDEPESKSRLPSMSRLWTEFVVLMATLGVAGLIMEPAATTISSEAGLSQAIVGVLLTAISTSIPELVTSVAAVRRGALTLSVAGIIGGNAFDTLFMAASDIAYRDGSIYHTMTADSERWVALTLLMAAILIMGLIRRERYGTGRIGAESVTIMALYGLGVMLMFTS